MRLQQFCSNGCVTMAYHEEDAEALLTSPLLGVACADGDPDEEDPAAPANVRLELRGLLSLSAPVMVQLSAQYAVTVVNQYFIGHQGASPLAAAAIGNTVISRCMWTIRVFRDDFSTSRVSCSGSTYAGTS